MNDDRGVFIQINRPIETAASIDKIVATTALEKFCRAGRVVATQQRVGEVRAADPVNPRKRIVPNGSVAVRGAGRQVDCHRAGGVQV